MLCYTGSYDYHFESRHKADCKCFSGYTGAWLVESDQLFDCTVKRRQLMGQTVYKSDVGYRSILLYLFQLNYNYKSAFVMSNPFQRTFQHLVDANTVLLSVIPPLPPLQRAPTQAPTSLPAPTLSPTSARQSSGMSTNLVTRPSMKQSLLILPLVQRSTLLSTPGWVRRLMMLALVSTSDVPDVFNQLVENMPDTVQIDPLLGYFERTWIAGLNGRAARCPPASWNQTDRVENDLNRTNNYCESFKKTFSSVVGHAHPTIYNFLSAVHLEQASTEGKMHSYSHRSGRGYIWRRILGWNTLFQPTTHTKTTYLDLLAQL